MKPDLIAVSCTIAVGLLGAACAGDGPGMPDANEAALRSSNACELRESGSRWALSGGRHELVAEFGRGEGEAFVDVWGIAAAPGGDVFVYDAGSTRVVKLGSDLQRTGAFGRSGRGPGEFSYQRVLPGDWVAADDSSVFVLGPRTISELDLSGEFRRYPTLDPPFPLPIKRIAARYGRIVYAVDRIDRRDGTRSLETWRIEASAPHTLLRSDAMPPLPSWHGRLVRGAYVDQAEPLWAVHGRCAFISDGAGDWILRVDLTRDRADTLRLPPREIPARTAEDEEWIDGLRRAGASIGMSTGSGGVQPTVRLKWQDLIVDPDGFIWLEPWRPHSMQHDPLTAWVVNPATGGVDSVVVAAFPKAFLPDGAFISVAFDRARGSLVLRAYAFEPAREVRAP